MRFNRGGLEYGKQMDQPSQELIKNTLSLHNASLEDAIKYGGELTRAALSAMKLTGNYKHTIVDTKVHMLIPGMYPAIPGWHTDGVPRGESLDPTGKGAPNIQAQEGLRGPRYHLMVTGSSSMTHFLKETDVELQIPDEPSVKLYQEISKQVTDKVKSGELSTFQVPSCRPVSWDWWELHTGTPAKHHEWRFLIRVTETNLQEPKTDLRDIIRTQQQGYMPLEFGW